MKHFIKKIVSLYLAIRTPLLWINFLLAINTPRPYCFIFLGVWLFTLTFSEYSYDRYKTYMRDIDEFDI